MGECHSLDASAGAAERRMIMYRITGTDHKYGCTQCYGEFKNMGNAMKHMNRLILALGHKVTFKCEEV